MQNADHPDWLERARERFEILRAASGGESGRIRVLTEQLNDAAHSRREYDRAVVEAERLTPDAKSGAILEEARRGLVRAAAAFNRAADARDRALSDWRTVGRNARAAGNALVMLNVITQQEAML